MIQRDGDHIVIFREIPIADALPRFMARVRLGPGGCWNWTGKLSPAGYGTFSFAGRATMVHRAAYLLMRGPIPDGFSIDHLCVNPEHLEAVTLVENVMRGASPMAQHARAEYCKHGHPFDEENTQVDARGRRNCRACRRERNRRRWYTHNSAAAKRQRRARALIAPRGGS